MPEESSKQSIPRRLWNIVKILLAVSLAGFAFSKTDLGEVFSLFKRLSFEWLAFSFTLFSSLTLVKSFQYYLVTGRQVSYQRMLYIVVTQNAISTFVAGGVGVVSYLTMLSTGEGVKFRRALSSFLIVKVSDLTAVWVVLLATAMVLWRQIEVVRGLVTFLLLAIPAIVIALFLAILLRRKLLIFLERFLVLWSIGRTSFARRVLVALSYFVDQDVRLILRLFLVSLSCSLVYIAIALIWFYTNTRAYSFDFPFSIVSFVNAFIQLISWIPIQVFGGLGVAEISLVYLFGIFGLPIAQIAAMAIGIRVILYGFTLILLLYLPISTLFGYRTSLILNSRERKND